MIIHRTAPLNFGVHFLFFPFFFNFIFNFLTLTTVTDQSYVDVQMLHDLNTYLNKAIPDTKLTIRKYLDVKFEYLVRPQQSVLV